MNNVNDFVTFTLALLFVLFAIAIIVINPFVWWMIILMLFCLPAGYVIYDYAKRKL